MLLNIPLLKRRRYNDGALFSVVRAQYVESCFRF